VHAERHAGHRDAEFLVSKIDDFGTPKAYNHYSVGWAHAMCAPYQWTKQVASHWGGTRNGTIVHWPNGIKAKGENPRPVPPRDRRGQDHPGGRRPARADHRQQHQPGPVRGLQHGPDLQRSEGAGNPRRPVLRDDGQPRHLLQRLDRLHQAPHALERGHAVPFDEDVWELYGPTTGRSRNNIVKDHPEKLASCSGCG
jgi:hypothetical protein